MADLPKSVGPGPLVLVLKEVLGLLINVAYKSCRALKEIQIEGSPNPHMESCVLKAKYVPSIFPLKGFDVNISLEKKD